MGLLETRTAAPPEVTTDLLSVDTLPTASHIETFPIGMTEPQITQAYDVIKGHIKRTKGHDFELLIGTPKDHDSLPKRLVQLKTNKGDLVIDARARFSLQKWKKSVKAIDSNGEDHDMSKIITRSHAISFEVYFVKIKRQKPITNTLPIQNATPAHPQVSKKPLEFGAGRPKSGVPKRIQKAKAAEPTPIERRHKIIKSYTFNGKPVAEMSEEDRKKAYKKIKLEEIEWKIFEALMVKGLTSFVRGTDVAKQLKFSSGTLSTYTNRIYTKFVNAGAAPIKKEGKARYSYEK